MSSEELGSLRLKLQQHLNSAPAHLNQVKDYLGTLKALAEQIEGFDPADRDAQATRVIGVELEDLQGLNQRAAETSILLRIAEGDENDILKADRAYKSATDLFSRISNTQETGAKETFARYSDLAEQLFATVLDLRERSRKHREKAYELTGRWTTVRGESRKENLEKWLEELAPHVRAGRRVPYDRALLGETIAGRIGPDEDREIISAAKLTGLIRDELKRLCLDQAGRLHKEATAKLPPDGEQKEVNCQAVDLKEAKERLGAGDEYTRSADSNTHQDPALEAWREKYAQLAAKIERWETQEKEAKVHLDKALDAADLFQSLATLQTARILYPCLAKLAAHTANKLRQLKVHLEQHIEDGDKQVKKACDHRDYDAALTQINKTKGEIEKYEPLIPSTLAKWSDVQLDLGSLKSGLEKSRESVEAEQSLWMTFKFKKEQLDRDLVVGLIQAANLEDVKNKFTDEEKKLFAVEWGEIDGKLTNLKDDQGKLEDAKSKDLTDETIVSIVKSIPRSSGLHQEAQQLLFGHYLAKHRQALEKMLVDGSILTDATWKSKGQQHFEEASRYGRQIQPTPDEALQALRNLHNSILAVWNLKVQIGSGDFAEHKRRLDETIQQAAGVEFEQALQTLRDDLLRRWRGDLWTFIYARVIEQDTLTLRKNSNLKQGLEKVRLLETELVGLIGEGDTQVFEAVKYYWHEEQLLVAVGIQAGSEYKAPDDTFWHGRRPDILREIRGYADKVGRVSTAFQRRINRDQAGDLFQTSSGYLALNQPRDEAIKSLNEQRNADQGRLKDDLWLCALLNWRQLEQLPEGIQEAGKVIAEVEQLGPYTQERVALLEKLSDVHKRYHAREDWNGIIQDMNQAVEGLKGEIGGFWPELNKASNQRIDEWRGERVNQLIDTVETQSQNPDSQLGQYSALEIAAVVLEILALQNQRPARLEQAINRILGQLKNELGELYSQVTEMLEGKQVIGTLAELEHSLGEMVNHVNTAVGWKEENLIVWEEFEQELYGDVIEWLANDAADDLKELQTRGAVVGWANGDLGRVKSRLASLLGERDWRWSDQPREKPLHELLLALKDLRSAETRLDTQAIPITADVKQYKTFIQAMQKAAQVLGMQGKQAVELFEGDLAQSGSELTELMKSFTDLGREMNDQQQVLLLAKPPGLSVAVNVHDYFAVEDIYRIRQMGNGQLATAPVKIQSVAEAIHAVENRQKSLVAWKNWSSQVIQDLTKIEASMEETSWWMHGLLSRAKEKCTVNHPKEIDKLRTHLGAIPDHPLCELAQKEASKLGQYQSNIGGNPREVWGALNTNQVNRLENCSLAKEGVKQEIKEIENYLGKKDDQGDISLWGKINELTEKLDALIGQLERYLPANPQRNRRSIGPRQATNIDELILEAEQIDREDPRIGAYRARLEQRRQR